MAIALVAAAGRQPATPVLPVWLAGCWAGERGGERFQERWVAADASTLLSVAHTTKGGKMTAFEFIRVIVRDGKAVYVAQPGGVPPTEFTATTMTEDRVVFENPAHDYPKVIKYSRRADGALETAISGEANQRVITVVLKRQ